MYIMYEYINIQLDTIFSRWCQVVGIEFEIKEGFFLNRPGNSDLEVAYEKAYTGKFRRLRLKKIFVIITLLKEYFIGEFN